MIQDIQGLRDQLADQPGNGPSSLADNLTALLLQIKAFNAQTDTPIGLQIDTGGSLSDKSPAEQVALLDDLTSTLQARSDEIELQLEELEPEALALQRDLQVITAERVRLTHNQELALETYLSLARSLDEARFAAQQYGGLLQVMSYAAVPEAAIGPRRLFNAVVGGILGALIGVLVILLVGFWRRGEGDREETGANSSHG